MIDRLDILIVKSMLETGTINGQTFSPANTEVMPNMFKCSNATWIISGTSSYTLRIKVWKIVSGTISFVGVIEVGQQMLLSDLKTQIGALLV